MAVQVPLYLPSDNDSASAQAASMEDVESLSFHMMIQLQQDSEFKNVDSTHAKQGCMTHLVLGSELSKDCVCRLSGCALALQQSKAY